MKKLPPVTENIRNIDELVNALALDHYEVAEWHQERDGQGKPSQVHLILDLKGLKVILRLKSKRATDTLIASLERHRDSVWGSS